MYFPSPPLKCTPMFYPLQENVPYALTAHTYPTGNSVAGSGAPMPSVPRMMEGYLAGTQEVLC